MVRDEPEVPFSTPTGRHPMGSAEGDDDAALVASAACEMNAVLLAVMEDVGVRGGVCDGVLEGVPVSLPEAVGVVVSGGVSVEENEPMGDWLGVPEDVAVLLSLPELEGL